MRKDKRKTAWAALAAATVLHVGGYARAASAPPTVCAIRWDAWYTNGEKDPAHYTAMSLGDPAWRERTPLHAKINEAGQVVFEPSQQTFDAEIRAAKQADLCWAYLTYGRDNRIDLGDPMMKALAYHRSSGIKSQTPYALILQARTLGHKDDYRDAVESALSLMRDTNYKKLTVDGQQRPLIFFFYDENDLHSSFGGSLQNLRDPFDLIRESSRRQNLGNPYIVVLAWSGIQAEGIRSALGADAISRYDAGERKKGVTPWSEFENSIPRQWESYARATPAAVVPFLSTGADIRARCETPPPWDHGRFTSGRCSDYTINPSTSELQAEFRDAVAWIELHRDKDPANLLLVYSWSECDEGGNCLMPTYGDRDGVKIRAISTALRAPH